MKKICIKLVLVAFAFAITSCSEEKEIIDQNELSVVNYKTIVTQLPENAIHVDKILADNGFIEKSRYNNTDTKQRLGEGLEDVIFYRKFFIVYPYDWNEIDKLNYLNAVKNATGKEIYTVLDICKFVDTWYVEIARNEPPKETQDKKKNVIVASTTNVDPQETNTVADGPGEVSNNDDNNSGTNQYYTSCTQVPLPPLYTSDDSNNGLSGSGSGPSDGINNPQE